VDELTESSAIAADRTALRERLAADGYLFFRGLLPAGAVTAAGAAVTAHLRAGGWLSANGLAPDQPRAVGLQDSLADPAFRRALASAAFNQLPYLAPLRDMVRRVLGPGAFSYPAKVLRAVYPERPATRTRGRYAHYDYAVSGVQDMLTTWLPLMDIPVALGGLAARPGGHLERPMLVPHVLRPEQRGWATAGYRPGDVIIFHCLTPHAALPNTTKALRLSGDFRWQLPGRPAPAELIVTRGAPAQINGGEMFGRLFGREPWWEPVPAGLALRPRAALAAEPPGPSEFFAVHPAWRRWRPPPSAVH
jgi:hypothetical protein